jgi:hypothetical protein
MKAKTTAGICVTLLALAAGAVCAEPTSLRPGAVQATDDAAQLEQKYTAQLNYLRTELSKSLPQSMRKSVQRSSKPSRLTGDSDADLFKLQVNQ